MNSGNTKTAIAMSINKMIMKRRSRLTIFQTNQTASSVSTIPESSGWSKHGNQSGWQMNTYITTLLLVCSTHASAAMPDEGDSTSAGNQSMRVVTFKAVPGTERTYYYHLDHLGSTTLITNKSGEVVQRVEYLPTGETFIEQQNTSWVSPHKFNGRSALRDAFRAKRGKKELDEETGLYYYGARYYDPRLSMWFGTDPMQGKYPGVSTYAYCMGNPVMFIDPYGEEPTSKEAAYIADHVYGKTDELIGGWQPYYMNSISNGLHYGIYEREMENGEMEYVLAFAGTNDLKDIQQDISQFMGTGPASQYGNAVSLGRQFASLYDGCEKTIVGHSLGGGLATAASMSTDIPAITFNPAAMTEHTKAQLGIQNSAGANVTNYVVAGEPLSVLQNKAGMQLPGNTNSIYIQNSSSNPFVNSFNAHKISTIKHILPR